MAKKKATNQADPTTETPAATATPTVEPDPHTRLPIRRSRAKRHPKTADTLAAFLADVPSPFRPRHLTEAIQLYADEEGLTDEERAGVDPHRFLQEFGLPNPQKRWRISGRKGSDSLEPREFEAADAVDAVRQYAELHQITETHSWTFRSFLLDY